MAEEPIYKWIKTAQKNVEIYFYRTRSGHELDIILQTQRGIMGVEIKARETIAPRVYRAMREIAQRVGPAWIGEMIVYQGDTIKKLIEPNIWAIPSRGLFI